MKAVLILVLLTMSTLAFAEPAQPRVLVIILDRSGSMQGKKLASAKDAAIAAAGKLKATDRVAVIAFDSEATVFAKPQAPGKAVDAAIAKIASGGGTNILPALKEAHELLEGISAKQKHVILLSDGEAPYDGVIDLVKEMRKAKVTISTVGVEGADRNLLIPISEEGGGRFYFVADLASLAKVFVKETTAALK